MVAELERYRRYLDLLDKEARLVDGNAEEYCELLSPGETIDLLCIRDFLADQELDEQQRREVERLDQLLVKHASLVAGNVFPRPDVARARWWWWLHEGPQVREQAKGVA